MWTATGCSPSLRFKPVSLVTASPVLQVPRTSRLNSSQAARYGVRAQVSGGGEAEVKVELRTCRTCKKMFNPLVNHPRACRFHTAHFGGETKRKFESVYTGGTMDTDLKAGVEPRKIQAMETVEATTRTLAMQSSLLLDRTKLVQAFSRYYQALHADSAVAETQELRRVIVDVARHVRIAEPRT